MRPTGPNRFVIFILMALAAILPQAAFGMADDTPYAALARFATALSKGDSAAAMVVFDPGMKTYGALESGVQALTAQADVLCSIEILQEKASGSDMVLDTDWYLQLQTKTDGGPSERRRERVSVTMRLISGSWRIISLSSAAIFAPINIR